MTDMEYYGINVENPEYMDWFKRGMLYACSHLPAFKNRPLIPPEFSNFSCWLGFFKGMETVFNIPGSVEFPNYDDMYTTADFPSDDFTISQIEFNRGFKTAKEMETEIVQCKDKNIEMLIRDYKSPYKTSFIDGFKYMANMILVKNNFLKLGFIKFTYA